jgi:predicted KAP-like P-loop ATPase
MSNESRSELREDQPLESTENDRLGYSFFAEELAQTITSRTPSDGYTIGVYGPWGSGKSTILNFVENELRGIDSAPAVVRFNPWWFSGRGDLVEKFLTEMGAQLESEEGFPDIRSNLADLSSALSKVPFGAMTGVPAGQGFAALHRLLQQDGESIDELKEGIHTELKESDRKIVVIIDDIDRLTPSEITLMFQLIKSIADFPNVVYVLAFEQEVVVNALQEEANFRDGKRYLQKIVQLPLHIPKQKEGALESLLLDQLAETPGDHIVEEERWNSLLSSGVLPLLDTPREVVRLANTVDVMSASVGNEVNFTDLVGLEALRVFHEDVYTEIKSSPNRFVGHRTPSLRSPQEPDQYEDLLSDLDSDREPVESILKTLFPMVNDNLNDQSSAFGDWDQMRVDKRICHRERLPVYFRLTIPDGEVSSTEMGTILSNIGDEEFLVEKIEESLEEPGVVGGSKANTIIRRLSDRVDEIQDSQRQSVVNAIFATGDNLVQTTEVNHNREVQRTMFFVRDIALKLDQSDRLNLLSEAIQNGNSPYLASRFIELLLREHGEYDADPSPEADRLLDMKDIDELKSVVVETVSDAAATGDLIDVPWLKRPLEQWRDWGDPEEPEEWVDQSVSDDFSLIEFIDAMSFVSTVNWTETIFYVDPRWVYEWIDQDKIENELDDLDQSDLTEHEEEVVQRYEDAKDILEDGGDPGTVENWLGF